MIKRFLVVADTTKVRIFKQITTAAIKGEQLHSCCWYHKGTNFQANHNSIWWWYFKASVVADTTKVRIFKQITTEPRFLSNKEMLLLIPQRYEFSSKSQLCFEYGKTTKVVADTTKVRIFKQITTLKTFFAKPRKLLLIPQRYEFSSKSQHTTGSERTKLSCCWYHKGTNFQANHN